MSRLAATLLATAIFAGSAAAAEPLKLGFVAPMSGAQAEYGLQMMNGMKTYMAQHGDSVADRPIEIIVKDSGGPNPDVAKRLTQELIVRDKVDFLVGYGFSPNAFAAAPLATESETPLIIFNAASSTIPLKSPYIARVSMTLAQHAYGIAKWANEQDIQKVYTLYADYAPGQDANKQFKKIFTAEGGEIVGEIGVPLSSPDFGPYMQRIKDAQPDAVFMWFPSGELANTMLKSYRERGLEEAGIRALGTSDLVDDHSLDSMGEDAVGLITSAHYSAAHDSELNKAFVETYAEIDPDTRPNFMAVAAYDGLAAIYKVTEDLGGDVSNGEKVMELLTGMTFESPRGPIEISSEDRDIVQNIYIRETKDTGEGLYNIEFQTMPMVVDQGKE
ncbi:ABC transporter substrate-binding protein [Amorphus orientalis]|uniref:Branched-chain amino acid transport system substrate-binding protein n=1 Tax=Amorphus orientalis TaxID=649198 RepID=A0AAE4AR24_9HYPH|nr:ABC transporter substrate-binding protein [Amorphus orientalis]MDQ0314711.1 branched-chain amino acid transport system substrate-binding protein [Amorphus orientalis]